MRNRLMSAMGLGSAMLQPVDPIANRSHRSSSSAGLTRSSTHSQDPTTPAKQIQYSEAADETFNQSFASNVSSHNGPTPKRSKPRKFFKVPATAQPRTSIGPRSARSSVTARSALKRKPLNDVDTNHSPVLGGRSPSKVTFEESQSRRRLMGTATQQEFEDLSFTASCIITGTPGIGLDRTHDYDGLGEDETADA